MFSGLQMSNVDLLLSIAEEKWLKTGLNGLKIGKIIFTPFSTL